jgi:O-6-methylguanine DNA methyltransferase
MVVEVPMNVMIVACRTAWGWMGVAASEAGLLGTTLPASSRQQALDPLLQRCPTAEEGSSSILASMQQKLLRYFSGEDVRFEDVTLDVSGATRFQTRVWDIVRSIPRGLVASYGWVAVQAGSPRGDRAVGQVMASNPFPVVVPCHRVVGQDGRLTGFGGGLDMKRRLLELEGSTWPLSPF